MWDKEPGYTKEGSPGRKKGKTTRKWGETPDRKEKN